MRLLTDWFRTKPTQEEVEEMAKRLYFAFYKGWEPDETDEDLERNWKRIVEDGDRLSSASFARKSWLAVAKEALK